MTQQLSPTTPVPAVSRRPGTRTESVHWAQKNGQIDDIGKVDFEDDEAHTICTVHVARDADGNHVLHIDSMVDADELIVTISTAAGLSKLQPPPSTPAASSTS